VDIAFAVSLPSDLERFLPLARRLPGAEFLLAPGRWPSDWLDSRRWTAQALRRQNLRASQPRRQFSLIVSGPSIPSRALVPWLRPGARVLPWTNALRQRFGDPRLSLRHEPGAAARARNRLGLLGDRPIWVVAVSAESAADASLFAQLAAHRATAELVVVASESAWLRSPQPLPRALAGPGVRCVREEVPWGELLAACERVIGNDRDALCDAIECGTPSLLLSASPLRARRTVQMPQLDLLPVVCEAESLSRQLLHLGDAWREQTALRLGVAASHGSQRMARALARAHARIAIDRMLRTLA
jgi:hypothetical protein